MTHEASTGPSGALAALASRLGFEIRPQIVWGSEIPHLPYQHSDSFVRDYTSGSQDGVEVALFHFGRRPRRIGTEQPVVEPVERGVSFADYGDAAAMAERGRRPVFNRLGIVVKSLIEGIPAFRLSPKNVLMQERGRSKRDVDLSSHPELSKMFQLIASDPEAVRRFFDRRLADFFVARGAYPVWVENGALFVPTSAAETADEAQAWLSDALAIKDALCQATPVEPTSDDLPSLHDIVVSEPEELLPHRNIGIAGALAAFSIGAYAWYEVGFEDALVLLVIMGLTGLGTLAWTWHLHRVETRIVKDLDEYEPWRNVDG